MENPPNPYVDLKPDGRFKEFCLWLLPVISIIVGAPFVIAFLVIICVTHLAQILYFRTLGALGLLKEPDPANVPFNPETPEEIARRRSTNHIPAWCNKCGGKGIDNTGMNSLRETGALACNVCNGRGYVWLHLPSR